MTEDIRTMRLIEKAHCRFGDKGDTGLYVLVPYVRADYDALVRAVTPRRVGEHFGGVPAEQVTCIPCPQIGALVVVVKHNLRGGVTASLNLDAHGKTGSGYLLGMQVPWRE